MMRQFRGARVFAVVTLGDCYMHTRFGGRQRPDLKIVRWISLGSDGTALPAPAAPALAKPVEPQSGVRTVEEPSLKEQMGGDTVPW